MAQTNPNDFTAQEHGLPLPAAKPTTQDGQPRGNAMMPLAHAATFAGMFSAGNRAYHQWFDEALKYGYSNQQLMLNDPVIYASLRNRITPTALLTAHIEPEDDTDPDQVNAAKNYDRFKRRFKGYRAMRRWLCYNGIWKGKSAAFTRWEKTWDRKERRTFEIPVGSRVIDGDKLAFKWSGEVGMSVGSGFQGPVEYVGGFGRVYYFTAEERDQLALFEYENEDADFFHPDQAGLIHGAGLRHRLFWLWALKSRLWSASIDFLEWWARGILIFYFEHGNDAHLKSVGEWVDEYDGQWQRMFPRMKDGGPGYKPIERIEPNVSTNSFLQDLIMNYLDDNIRYVVLGQTSTMKANSTGLGSKIAEAHEGTFDQIVKYDSNFYDECETYSIVRPWYEANYPGMPHGYAKSEVDSPNVQELMDAAESIYEMGGNVPEDALIEAAGLPETKDGDTILTQVQPNQPAATGGMPEGVPQVEAQSPDQPVRMSARRWNEIVKCARHDGRAARFVRSMKKRVVLY